LLVYHADADANVDDLRQMKRTQAQTTRVPSPTPTAFSGISNYRSESYRPIRETKNGTSSNAPAVPSVDARIVARTHFDELSRYLAVYLARGALCLYGYGGKVLIGFSIAAPANSRSTARQKLTRLTKQQFQELSTDVYDELVRRKKNSTENEGPSILHPTSLY
jgi:protein SPA2